MCFGCCSVCGSKFWSLQVSAYCAITFLFMYYYVLLIAFKLLTPACLANDLSFNLECSRGDRCDLSLQYQYIFQHISGENSVKPLVFSWWDTRSSQCNLNLKPTRQNLSLQYKYNIKQTSDKNKEKFTFLKGLFVDPIPNS